MAIRGGLCTLLSAEEVPGIFGSVGAGLGLLVRTVCLTNQIVRYLDLKLGNVLSLVTKPLSCMHISILLLVYPKDLAAHMQRSPTLVPSAI